MSFIGSIIVVVVVVLFLGVLAAYIGRAPFIDPEFKALAKWLLIGAAILVVLIFILGLVGYGPWIPSGGALIR